MVVGGLLVATLFTLFLVPAVLSVAVDLREALARLLGRRPPQAVTIAQPVTTADGAAPAKSPVRTSP